MKSLPFNWEFYELGQLGRWLGGGTPSKTNDAYWDNGSIPWISPKDMKVLLINRSGLKITKIALREKKLKLIPANSLLMVTRSGILSHTFPVSVNATDVVINQDLKALVPFYAFNSAYLCYHLSYRSNEILANCSKDGTTVSSINLDDLKSIVVPIAPLKEQLRIVSRIERIFNSIDSVIYALSFKVNKKVNLFRESILKAAVEGRLVPTEAELARREDRDFEHASELLNRILAERKQRFIEQAVEKARAKAEDKAISSGKSWTDDDNEKLIKKEREKATKKYKEPEPPDIPNLPELPEGWCWATLDSICEVQGGVSKGKKYKNIEVLEEVPYLRVANVQRGYLDLSSVKYLLVSKEEIGKLKLKKNDVLFNEGGDIDKLGRGWIWNEELPLCIHQNHVYRARVLDNAIIPKLLSHYSNSVGRKYFFQEGKQTTNLASISISKLKSLPIPIPPQPEQTRIIEEIERLYIIQGEISALLEKNINFCQNLRQAILKWAFEGKLVDQDPNDEPASLLLERIKAERDARSTDKPKRGRKRNKS